MEEIDFSFQIKNILIVKILNLFSKLLFNLPIKMVLDFLLNKTYKKLNNENIIICTTNSLGVTLSF